MTQEIVAFHYVCTHSEAASLIMEHKSFWVSNCGCREKRGNCLRSRIDVCLMFRDDIGASGTGKREITEKQALEILDEAVEKHLVARPFRNEIERTRVDGICFCCDDCCGYFIQPDEKCDKGIHREKTDVDTCNHCGTCVTVCYFSARKLQDDILIINGENCYGCGLCVNVCPEECIRMTPCD